MTPTPILLFGATGRMGRAVRGCLTEFPEVSLRACVARSAAAMLRSIPGAARALFEVDLVEHHHGAKRDAPSGTALAWAALLAPGEVRIHSIRSGTVAGIHRAIFAGAGETLEVVHTVSDRAVFARGALRAACFLHGQPPGLYTLEQTLAVP